MEEPTKILALIPARGGSKGVLRKNVRDLCGKPTIAYTIEAARSLEELFFKVIVSTDDTEIANVSKQYGAEVPFMRPSGLSTDDVSMLAVVQHAISTVENSDGVKLDYVCLLQPTAPLRCTCDLRKAVHLLDNREGVSVISVVRVLSTHPVLMKKIGPTGLLEPYFLEEVEGTRRQDYSPPAYMRNGAIYLTSRKNVMDKHSIWGDKIIPYEMPAERSVSIDDEVDFLTLESIIRSGANKHTC